MGNEDFVQDFENKCKDKEQEIKAALEKTNGEFLSVRVRKNITSLLDKKGCLQSYINFVKDYVKKSISDGKFVNDLMRFVAESWFNYKKMTKSVNQCLDGIKLKCEERGKSYLELEEIGKIFQDSLKEFKSKHQELKKIAAEKKDIMLPRTLKHNILYCKNGDVTKSNKIGFLDYLLNVVNSPAYSIKEDRNMVKKLRAPFDNFSITDDINSLDTSIQNYCKKNIKEYKVDQNSEDFNNYKLKMSEIAKKLDVRLNSCVKIMSEKEIRDTIQNVFGSLVAACAFNDSDLSETVTSILQLRTIGEILEINIKKCLDGDPNKMIKEGVLGLLINGATTIGWILGYPFGVLYKIGSGAYNTICSFGKLAKGLCKKIDNEINSKNIKGKE